MSATRENKEALHIQDNTKTIETNRVDEKILMEENATRVTKKTYDNSWIVGSSTNGLVGTNTGTQGGGQQVVGASGRTTTIYRVVNPNNSFRERFNDVTFKNATTTADWAVTAGQLDMTTTEIAVSESIALNNGTITKATIIVTVSSGSKTNLTFELTADGGINWESVTEGTEHTFTNTGADLRFRITAAGTVTITYVKVVYS